MKLNFVTGNKYKVMEAKAILGKHGIEVVQVKLEKEEPKEFDLKKVAEMNALFFSKKLGEPVMVEDTGLFFHEYKNFPGNHPKLMYETLGYKGLLKLMDGVKDRRAEFRTVVAWCDGKKVKSFVGSVLGEVTNKIHGEKDDVMPYERIIKIDGEPVTYMSREKKNRISHRAKAFMQLGEYLCK
ncbi:non-canonical purine NTP pyrophosphatase [Candidatus Woesearchaeota archaeon]|nr:non-canonical purine NTP pyrophosphatase [Candidatus Woesearchaeota archaeon]